MPGKILATTLLAAVVDGSGIAENALFVPLSEQQLERQLERLVDATA